MNNKFLIGLVVFSLLFFSCTQKKDITYTKYSSVDNTYSVEIPSDAIKGKCIADYMNFVNNNTDLIISIQYFNEENLDDYINNNDITNKTFSYTLFQSSDTTSFYKITRGNNMWSAYELYMLKRLEGKNYLIKVSSDILGQSEIIEITKHIYSSIKQTKKGTNETVDVTTKNTQVVPLEKTYTTKFYSIKYPKQWLVQKPLDEMTEVYIGSQTDNFGFTVVRFETDYSLSEINAEGNENLRQTGFRILENKQGEIKGEKCYKTVQEISIQNQKVKHISYTFKKDNMLYNIKFGSVATKTQQKLVTEIMKSFQFNSL